MKSFELKGVTESTSSSGYEKNKSRHIVAKFVHWKQTEMIVKTAREKKPHGVLFYNDYSAATLARMQAQMHLHEMRKRGKIAYFIKDRLIVNEKRPDKSTHQCQHRL